MVKFESYSFRYFKLRDLNNWLNKMFIFLKKAVSLVSAMWRDVFTSVRFSSDE